MLFLFGNKFLALTITFIKKIKVFIFLINVGNAIEVILISDFLTSIPSIKNWNFDLDDCDKILRIEAEPISPRGVDSLLQTSGFVCRELDY